MAYSERNVGLGVAAGVAYSPTKLTPANAIASTVSQVDAGQSFAWGFFVDIPLLDTFYISPAAMLYEFNLGQGHVPITDIDLNFKFIVPISLVRLGVGATFGLTAAGMKYGMHVGGLGFFSVNLLANLDAFLMLQYKKIIRDGGNLDDLHGYAGAMFHF